MTSAATAMRRLLSAEWLPRALFVLGWTALAVLAGSLATALDLGPAAEVRKAVEAWRTARVRADEAGQDPQLDPRLWVEVPPEVVGVVRHQPDRVAPGLTLVCSAEAQAARLLDLEGREVHRWAKTWRDAFPAHPHVRFPVRPERIFYRDAHLFPDGRLLVMWTAAGDSPYGYGMGMLDRDSTLLWSLPRNTHHDLDVAPDGRIVALDQQVRAATLPGLEGRLYLDDLLVVVSPEGTELDRFSLGALLEEGPKAALLAMALHGGTWDPLHTNTAWVVDAAAAARVPGVEVGQVLVCMRDLGLIGVVDLEARSLKPLAQGPWMRPHDPQLLPDGRLLVFDNLGGLGAGTTSRILELDPSSGRVLWSYEGSPGAPFVCAAKGHVQRLANGNTLIEQTYSARVFEVDPSGEVVWDWRNPIRSRDGARRSMVNLARRYPRPELTFLSAAGGQP